MTPILEFVLATANADKAREIAEIVGPSMRLQPRPPWAPDVEETENTLVGNARLKARAIASATGTAALADDTGLEVEDLGGAPGVHAARYAGEAATYEDNVAKLLASLAEVAHVDGVSARRRARFRTVAVASWPDGREVVAEGAVEGTIASEPRGEGGSATTRSSSRMRATAAHSRRWVRRKSTGGRIEAGPFGRWPPACNLVARRTTRRRKLAEQPDGSPPKGGVGFLAPSSPAAHWLSLGVRRAPQPPGRPYHRPTSAHLSYLLTRSGGPGRIMDEGSSTPCSPVESWSRMCPVTQTPGPSLLPRPYQAGPLAQR